MLVEVDYTDGQGICPFCGGVVMVEHEPVVWWFDDYRVRVSPCVCKNDHLFFVCIETNIVDDDYMFSQRMFVHFEDWQDHIEMSILPGEYQTPLLDNLDDAGKIKLDLYGRLDDAKK